VAAVALGGGDSGRPEARGAALAVETVVQHHDHKHAGARGHLGATQANVELVSTLALRNGPSKRIADVGVWRGHAYLGAWGGACASNGVHVVDIRNPARPKKVAFIAARRGSYPGEGVQALHLDTASFRGDVLVTNNESCDRNRRLGGLNLYDVSNPRRPKKLVEGFGDHTVAGIANTRIAHEIHSVFAWDAGRRAYAVMVDNIDPRDVDIVDISNPRKPRVVAEYDLTERFPQIVQGSPPNLVEVFHHDVIVKKIGSRQIMLVSYWDGGYVQLDVTDPRNARYLADSDFASPDTELAAQSDLRERPEGNAHQSEFTRDNRFVIAADEDFGPTGLEARADDDGAFAAAPGSGTPGILPGNRVSGPTRYVGRACEGDAAVPPAAGATFAIVVRGACIFTGKLQKIQAKGYDAALVVNNEGTDGCGFFRMAVDGGIPAFSVSRATGFLLFDRGGYDANACRVGRSDLLPEVAVGADGDSVTVRSFFDGWGYVHLFRNGRGKLEQLDTYAIPEAMDPKRARGNGLLSVHEVAASHERNDLAYLSYYAGGLRVIEIDDGKIVEAGRFIDVRGNNFWGVQVFRYRGREYVAASDIDFGLYVFRYTGD
jgi:LVIVD repeat